MVKGQRHNKAGLISPEIANHGDNVMKGLLSARAIMFSEQPNRSRVCVNMCIHSGFQPGGFNTQYSCSVKKKLRGSWVEIDGMAC